MFRSYRGGRAELGSDKWSRPPSLGLRPIHLVAQATFSWPTANSPCPTPKSASYGHTFIDVKYNNQGELLAISLFALPGCAPGERTF